MKLELTPFTEEEKSKDYILHKFKERGYPFAFLREKNNVNLNSGNKYKFGLITPKKKYYWFFFGKSMCKNRYKALEIYTALLKHCQEKNFGEPFAFKKN